MVSLFCKNITEAPGRAPTTLSVAPDGFAPMPTPPPFIASVAVPEVLRNVVEARPFESTEKRLVVAEPFELVEDAISKRTDCEPYVPCRESRAYAVDVPSASDFLVLSKKNCVLSPRNAEPFANWIAPVPPTAVAPAPFEIHVP